MFGSKDGADPPPLPDLKGRDHRSLLVNPEIRDFVDVLTIDHQSEDVDENESRRQLTHNVRINRGLGHMSVLTLWTRAWNTRPTELRRRDVMVDLGLVPPPTADNPLEDIEDKDARVDYILTQQRAREAAAIRAAATPESEGTSSGGGKSFVNVVAA